MFVIVDRFDNWLVIAIVFPRLNNKICLTYGLRLTQSSERIWMPIQIGITEKQKQNTFMCQH